MAFIFPVSLCRPPGRSPTFAPAPHRSAFVLTSLPGRTRLTSCSAKKSLRQNIFATAVSSNGSSISQETPITAKPLPPSNQPRIPRHISRFLRLILQQWKLLFPALACALIASLCAVAEPILFGRILGTLAEMHTMEAAKARAKLYARVLAVSITYFVELITTGAYVVLAARIADRAMRTLRQTLFRDVLANDVAFFDQTGRVTVERTASLQLRIARQAIWDNLGEDRGIRSVLEAVLGVILCLRLTGSVGIPVFCVFLPIITTCAALLGLRLGRLGAQVEGKEAEFVSYISERMRGLRTLKAFGAEDKETSDLSTFLDESRKTSTQFIKTRSFTECANRLNIYITIILFFCFGGYMVSVGTMNFETFSSLVGFIWVLNFCMHGILFTLTDMSKLSVALSKVYSVIDQAQSYRQSRDKYICPPALLPQSFQGEVCFNDIHFHYPSRPESKVLRGISFKVNPGQTVALVGESGGGKSTIAALLCQFYAPTKGSVTLDGYDIQCLPRDVYARQLSVVDQEPFLFQGTIRDNIAYGLPDEVVSDEEIIRAAKEANAHNFISQLSEGYNTVWHAGSNLSGGQRQRIAIARSLVKSPRILVLDEATSQLDTASEQVVQSALERIMQGRTTLIIAHRLSTVRTADQILFVQGGEIVECGTYNELLAKDGQFRNLVDSSAGLVLDSAVEGN